MNKESAEKTFEQCASDPIGTVYADEYENEVRFIILRGPASLCAYVGVPVGHPLADHQYDNLPIRVHGGLTFSKAGDGDYLPAAMYWYGWDYAHAGDRCFYDLTIPRLRQDGQPWTPATVRDEVWAATYDFRKFMTLAESIQKVRG